MGCTRRERALHEAYCHIQMGVCTYVMACSPDRPCMSVVPYVLQGNLLKGWATLYQDRLDAWTCLASAGDVCTGQANVHKLW